MTNLDIKKQRHDFALKGLVESKLQFSCRSCTDVEVGPRRLNTKKIRCLLNCGVEKTPLDYKEIKLVKPKVNQP